ncbi:MAG: ATP-binding protein [Rhodobacteraceae bacterium]|nr:ATP-binding protein [Paracoccaceae bacterium]
MASLGHAAANPTKAFFVRMITRDIALEDCILDLIDNSIDGAWQLEGGQPMTLNSNTDLSRYKIDISISPNSFCIRDNCGGITLDDAAEYAFTFGRKETDVHESYSIGVYGIGMKRAVFKLGTVIKITSTYIDDSDNEQSFSVPIKVDDWLNDEKSKSWDFDIETSNPLPSPGVEIQVDTLTENTAISFGDPAFLRTLRRIISRDYSLHLHRGLSIHLNGEAINGWNIELRESADFAPMRIAFEEEVKGGQVQIEILAGMAAPPPETSDPDEKKDGEDRSGWYVICNGRVVLAADKSSTVGWGTDGWPKWHPQYAGFLGLILFTSENAELLPITTTKRSIDSSSWIFRQAVPRLREVSKNWTNYTNIRKQNLETAKKLESDTKSLPIFNIQRRETVALPTWDPKPKVKMANIAYSVPLDRLRKLARGFGNINMSYKDVGYKSFDYSYDELVDEE